MDYVRIRGLIVHLLAMLTLAACAAGSGRQGTEIVVSGTGPTAAVQGGANAVFVMTVTNTGPYDASNIKLIDNVGNQLKLISITCAASGGATCPSSPTVEMTIPSMPDGGALVFSVTVQVDTGATGTIQNSMVASFAEELDPTGASTSVTATAFSVTTNVVVSGTGPTGTLVGGSPAVFVMTVTNNGPDATDAFNVYDNVGNGLSLNGITCTASGGAVCPTTVGVLTAVETLPAGGVLTFTVDTTIGQNVNGTVSNELVADIKTNPTPSSDIFYATATVVTADLNVSGTAPTGPLLGGSAAAFTMVVTNNGPGTAQNINITNALSSGITASGAITCVASGGAACPSVLGATMTLASMPDAGVLTFTVPFTVNLGTSGQITDTMTVSSTTDARGNQMATVGVGSGSSNLIVTETGTTQVNAGSNAVFTAVVANTGPSPASNITVSYTLTGPAGTVATVTCAAVAAISCPPTLGPVMVLPLLGVGRAVSFTFTVPVPVSAAGQGAIINTVTASAVGNGDVTQNVASFSTVPINSNNGTYQLFAANGNQYTLTINFDSNTYLLSGNGQNIQKSFSADATGGGYTVSGTQRFRVATDLIVGGQDFGAGVIPYVAARVFGSTVQQLAGTSGGQYNLVTLDIPTTGPTVTYAGTARVSGNTLAICQSTTGVATTQNCASLPAGSLQSYALSIDGNIYTGINTVTAAPFTFQEALIGATAALLSAGTAPDGSLQLVIGLPDASVLAGGVTQGASTTGDWLTMTLTSSSYAFTGQLGTSDSAPLQRISPNAGPFSMLVGNRVSDGAQLYVMQSVPLAVAFGGYGGAASGLLQVAIP
jgi:uncharacterized repeat protein (TIGR01451 family)